MFYYCSAFIGDGLSGWIVSNVQNMSNMFYSCEKFNQNLQSWNVSKVTNMSYMFYYCPSFTGGGLSAWDVSNVQNMKYMFYQCSNFIENLGNWASKISKVRDMSNMFQYATVKQITITNWKWDLTGKNTTSITSS
jgi:surface protein